MTIELVFIHGWGFDTRIWEGIASLLPQFRQRRINLGFYGAKSSEPLDAQPRILVGHSLGFVHGLRHYTNWAGWVAINSFPRFVSSGPRPGCAPAASLRELRMRMQKDPAQCLKDFYSFIGAETPPGQANTARLCEGLDELRDGEIEAIIDTLAVPGLVLASGNDPLVPLATSHALAAQAENFALHGTAGHILPFADAAWCARQIIDFISVSMDRL